MSVRTNTKIFCQKIVSIFHFLLKCRFLTKKGPGAMYHAMQQQPQKIRGLIAVPVSPPMPMHHALQHQHKPIVYLTGKFQVPNGITRPPSQQFLPMKTTMEPPVMSQPQQGFNNIKVNYLQDFLSKMIFMKKNV